MLCTQYNLPSTVRNDLRHVFPMTRVSTKRLDTVSITCAVCSLLPMGTAATDRLVGRPVVNRPTGRVATLGVYFLHDREMGM